MTDLQEIWLRIIDCAKPSHLTKFRFIKEWSEYKFYKSKRKYYKWLLKRLQKVTKILFKDYCSKIKRGNSNIIKLLACTKLAQTISFYKQELNTITEMIFEYEAYLFEGNLLTAFLGEPRTEYDLRDFRDKE